MIEIDADSDVSLVAQIHAEIRAAIARGEVQPDDRLPAVRQLAGDLQVNLNTVARAYRQLEADGLIRSRRGRGTVVLSSREKGRPRAETLAGLQRSIRALLTDARLAGLSASDVGDLVVRDARAFWPEKEES